MIPGPWQLLTKIWRGPRHRLLGGLFAIALLWNLNADTSVFAQIEDDEPPAEAQELLNAQFEFSEDQFDSWVFQELQNAAVARLQLDKLLTLHTDDVDRACKLTTNQRKKLQLAGLGDIIRFFEQVEAERQKFLLLRKDPNKINEFWQNVEPLQSKIQAGLHGDGSLFQKTLRNMLDKQQIEYYSRHDNERRLFHYRAKVEIAVAMLENTLPLRDEQRQKLIALIVEQTKPPRQFGQYDYYFVMWSLSKLPESKLKPLFDVTDWKILSQQLAQVQGMENWLKENGVLSKEAESAESDGS